MVPAGSSIIGHWRIDCDIVLLLYSFFYLHNYLNESFRYERVRAVFACIKAIPPKMEGIGAIPSIEDGANGES